ncbi:conjugative transposon protein TraM [Sphingobacterium sp.]|uniref:conjugative transposon protein TraM n=1 Tax=Sphingobacterium sp. TaxID=341027 RepID=UPI0028A91986|nr:conjugative transposon protein TraM [Sphingobacterium sp.]
MHTSTPKNSKHARGRFLLLAPVFTIPFLLLMFWKLGVGKDQTPMPMKEGQSGFPSGLPEVGGPVGGNLNKLEHYEKAERDSQKLRELKMNDPYYLGKPDPIGSPEQGLDFLDAATTGEFSPDGRDPGDLLSKEILGKLSELQKELAAPTTRNEVHGSSISVTGQRDGAPPQMEFRQMLDVHNAHLDSLSRDPVQDMEISQLNTMLDKVLDIQYPERLRSRALLHESRGKDSVLSVEPSSGREEISVLGGPQHATDTFRRAVRFYSVNDSGELQKAKVPIMAASHGRQELTDGSQVKLHLLEKVNIAGHDAPKGTPVFGLVRFSAQRMEIRVKHIRIGRAILPIEMQVHDLDGMQGVNVPGNLLGEGLNETAERSIQEIGMSSLEPSWEARAATLGLQAARKIATKRMKVKKVVIPADYRVLLFDKKNSTNN